MLNTKIDQLQDIIGTDIGDRGMKALIVPGDLRKASEIFATPASDDATLVLLSGFPCCVNENPPTETDGPPGTMALARAGVALGYRVVLVTDECNRAVFAASFGDLDDKITMEAFPAVLSSEDEDRLQQLAQRCQLIIACERSGPATDGNCYTMRGIDMTAKGLIAPVHKLVSMTRDRKVPFLAIGDGGNELGMGKVLDKIIDNPKIADGKKIGCAIAADYLVAASVSNWGGYALAAGAALVRAETEAKESSRVLKNCVDEWVSRCLPTEEQEVGLLDRCVAVGCRDGVSGKMEATVDGMPLETSLQCLRDIMTACLASSH